VTQIPVAADAYAKVNLALAVYRGSADGYHPLRGIFQSVSLFDTVTISPASDDAITVSNAESPSDESNTAWRALDAVRRAARLPLTSHLDIDKRIPAGAGLGGGSADAAAVIGLLASRYGLDEEVANEIAISIGSDVPFALRGGTALVTGRGDTIVPMEPLDGFALAIVVPPFSLGTPEVFREWDRLDGPVGAAVSDDDLPPVLRGREPIRNDLYPAAVSLDPRIAEWRSELASIWGSPVCMTGSGSALFSFFASVDEAEGAAAEVAIPTRAAVGVGLVQHGWKRTDE
jgi:4-diphosphocytidyl-2-C-methyl-D-erythritol kinase